MGTNVRQNIVTNGLVMYLDAGSRMSYRSGSTTWSDLSGNGYNGTLTNGPTFNSTNQGNIVFDATNDYVQVSDNANLRTSSGTYSVWYNCITTLGGSSAYASVLFKSDAVGSYNGYIILATNTYVLVSIKNATTGYALGGYDATGWTNATLVNSSGTSFSFYLNGVLMGTQATATVTISSQAMRLGIGLDSFWANFSGSIAQTMIYNRALSAQEIAQNYNTTKTRFGLS
jgi:hypothetical protein